MTTKLRLSDDLALPIDAVTEAIGFLGRRGSGKSYAAQKLAEEFHRAGAQFVALDPVGNWWSLRLAGDGQRAGIPVPVFGGLHGDVPLEPTAGKVVADTIVDRGISAVIDVSQFESDADKARFARAFCDRFYFRKKSAPSAVHVFLEEAQEFIPQNPSRDEPLMLHAFTRLAKLGRNFGIGISMLSQRPQEVNKKVINLAELLFVFQLTGVHERKAVQAWISDKGIDGEDIDAELPKLQRGHPHTWSPAWLQISKVIEIGKKWTFDASSTPKVGASAVVRELSPIDLEKLRVDMAATIERAKAEDPRELRKQVAALTAELAKLKRAGAGTPVFGTKERIDPGLIDAAVQKALARHARELTAWHERRVRTVVAVAGLLERSGATIAQAATDLQQLAALPLPAVSPNGNGHAPVAAITGKLPPDSRREIPRREETRRIIRQPLAAGAGSSALSRGQQKILNALAELAALGIERPSRVQLGLFASYNLSGGSGAQHLADLSSLGLVTIPGAGAVQLTEAGQAAADPANLPASLAELHHRVLAKAPTGQRRIAEHLIRIYPQAISRAELGTAVDYNLTGGTGAQHLADLVNLGAVRIPGPGQVMASELLFPEGLS